MTEKVIIGFKVDPDFKRLVRVAAANEDQGMSEYVRIALEEKLGRHNA